MSHEQPTHTEIASIPIIRLTDAESRDLEVRESTVRRLVASLEEWGFLLLDGHGIAPQRLAEAFAASEAFFRLDEATKQACQVPESLGNRGYVGLGGETAVGARAADLKEFFHVGQPRPAGTTAHLGNSWPDESVAAGFRETMLGLYGAFESVASRVLALIEEGLGVEPGRWQDWIRGGNSILRLIHYPPLPNERPADAVRAAPHADINLITLLCEGTSGGLEIQRPDGSWQPVSSFAGQLVVNVGDMLALATGGRVRSTPHRVVNPHDGQQRASRFSMPFFVHPRSEIVLGRGASGPVTAGAFLAERLAAIRS
jgi:isopenicillin N synthase-like dioxygenase